MDTATLTENEAGRLTEVRFEGDRAEMRIISQGDIGVSGVVASRGRLYSVNGKLQYTREPALKGKDPGQASIRAACSSNCGAISPCPANYLRL